MVVSPGRSSTENSCLPVGGAAAAGGGGAGAGAGAGAGGLAAASAGTAAAGGVGAGGAGASMAAGIARLGPRISGLAHRIEGVWRGYRAAGRRRRGELVGARGRDAWRGGAVLVVPVAVRWVRRTTGEAGAGGKASSPLHNGWTDDAYGRGFTFLFSARLSSSRRPSVAVDVYRFRWLAGWLAHSACARSLPPTWAFPRPTRSAATALRVRDRRGSSSPTVVPARSSLLLFTILLAFPQVPRRTLPKMNPKSTQQ